MYIMPVVLDPNDVSLFSPFYYACFNTRRTIRLDFYTSPSSAHRLLPPSPIDRPSRCPWNTRLGSLSLSRRLHRSDIPSPNLAPAVLSLLLHPNEDARLCFPSLFFSRDPFSAPNSHGLTSVRLMNLLLSFCHISCCTPSHSSISRNLLLHLLLRMDQSLHKAECVGVDACADIGLRLVIISELRTLTLHESNVTSRLVAVVQTRVRVFLLLYESETHLYW